MLQTKLGKVGYFFYNDQPPEFHTGKGVTKQLYKGLNFYKKSSKAGANGEGNAHAKVFK